MRNVSAETIQLVKDALANGRDELAKNITIATGLTAYDLQAPATNLYPTITPIRNTVPRVRRRNPGDAAHWKVITSITGSGFDSMGWVPEGQRASNMTYTSSPVSKSYVTIGEEDYLSFEAEAASEGFEDINATATMRLLQKLFTKEEKGLIGGNASLALGTTPTPSLSASGSGATLPAATYSVIAVALTYEGWRAQSVSAGLTQSLVVTGRDGQTFTLNGGVAQKSANATQAVTLGQTLFASIASPPAGAMAYAWYIGTAGNERLQAITTLNSIAISAPLNSTNQLASALTAADYSKNASLAFDGLLTYNALGAPSQGGPAPYLGVQPTGTAGTGTPLTASGRGSIVEIDNMFQSMWDNARISPTVMYVNSQEQKNITSKVLSNASGPLLRFNSPGDGKQPYMITANGVVAYYYNPFSVDGGTEIPVKVHPDIPPGTILAWAESLPPWFQSNEVPNVAEILTRRDYYRLDWPLRTRAREFGTYAEEALAVYYPAAIGVLTNIGNG